MPALDYYSIHRSRTSVSIRRRVILYRAVFIFKIKFSTFKNIRISVVGIHPVVRLFRALDGFEIFDLVAFRLIRCTRC